MKKKGIDFQVDANNCFIVTSHRLNKDGYCYCWHEGHMQRAHRLVYQECYGVIPDGLVVRHKCDVRNCVNPEHLELGTQKENIHDAIERGRFSLGGSLSGLSENDVKLIKTMLKNGMNTSEIAETLKINRRIIWRIKTQRTWTNVVI